VSDKVIAEIDLDALSHNLNEIKKRVGKRSIIPIVKANAYGHGLIEVSRHLIEHNVKMLGVAFKEEAVELREAGIKLPILVLFERENIDSYLKYNLIPTLFDFKTAKRLSKEAQRQNLLLPIHIKIDTGMGRIGLDIRSAEEAILGIKGLKGLKVEGLMSHLSEADLVDKDFTLYQIQRFRMLVSSLKRKGITFKYLHIANSAGILRFQESYLNAVRPGIMLYGYGCDENDNLKPVLNLKCRVLHLKNVPSGTPISYGRTFITRRRSIIATLPLGYADGYSRRLSNCGEVLINGRRAPVVGRVCMDTFMVDVTDIPDISIDSEVVLIGSSGRERITAKDIADSTGTIPYEVLTSIGQRVKRVYRKGV
jgi:alanine racemase